jgi:hypothetical protein
LPLAVGVAIGFGACSGSVQLPNPTFINFVDTLELYSLRGTPVPTVSAFDIVRGFPARIELGDEFDFAFDFSDGDTAILIPGQVLGIPIESGVQPMDRAFDDILMAPIDEYIEDSIMSVDVGTVFAGRSRLAPDFCSAFLGALPRFAKFEVLAIDRVEGKITLKYLVNFNCGYRSLEPGLPEQ